MNKKEFLDCSRDFFRNQGFKVLKKSKFYYEAKDFVYMIELQLSNYSELYYFNYNIRIKDIHKDINQIDSNRGWDFFSARIISTTEKAFIIEYDKIDKNSYVDQLFIKYKEQIEPILNGGLDALINLYKSDKLYICFKPETVQYLKKYYNI